jgi:hypothetical protein
MQISQDDVSIAFKFHNFVQIVCSLMWAMEKVFKKELCNTLIYLNQYVSME